MKKIVLMLIVLISAIIAGCSDQYDNEDVVAIVGDEELTVADVRLFQNLEEKELNDAVKDYVKEEIMVQDAKKMGIDVSKKVEELKKMNTSFPQEQTKDQEEYAKKKANELDMSEEEYYEKYLDLSTERSAYVMAFLEKEIGELNKEDDADEYVEKVKQFCR
ncbi:hypothetical protein [Virgibacillus sp. DJP39]|uniref:hypothetical protein n=1 Tax=Virgibacillus sp. DJP39 TaxID=3409790 RepID=UPI003BB63C84